MSVAKRRGESTAPALFPFLAVLLCTIGALILILVVTVTKSHANAKQAAAQELEDLKETADLVQTVSDELQAQRDKLRGEVEKKRHELENIEDHIARLREEMARLLSNAEALEQQSTLTDEGKEDKRKELEKLKTAIDLKKKELADEIENQKKRKPAFAIIPYEGPNGTSRRPIYLECTRDGVIIQPEGILISLEELRPPHGPGNPLDAALRVLRVAYQKKDTNFGITHPPYPLLMVRPDGVTTYALARSAMGGWDDQLGYELIEQDMTLAFPQGVEGLKHELEVALDVARRRQAALVASLPKRIRNSQAYEDESWGSIDGSADQGSSAGSNGSGSGYGSGSNGNGSNPASNSIAGVSSNGGSGSGGSGGGFIDMPNAKGSTWEMIQPFSSNQAVGSGASIVSAPGQGFVNGSGTNAINGQGGTEGSMGRNGLNANDNPAYSNSNDASNEGPVTIASPTQFSNNTQLANPSVVPTDPPSLGGYAGAGNSGDGAGGNATGMGNEGTDGSNDGYSGASSGSQSVNSGEYASSGVNNGPYGSGGPGSGGSVSNGAMSGGSDSGGNGQSGGAGANGSGTAVGGGNAGADSTRANAFSSGSATGSSSGAGSLQSMSGSAQPNPNGDPNQSPNISMTVNQDKSPSKPPAAKHVRSEGDLTPISVSAGRGWAAARAETKATPVNRPINIVALNDRWMIRSSNNSNTFDATITMDNGPQEAGKALATSIRQRVDSWGVSVQGGYWVPSLTIEAASDASLSVARLQRLLEGSGVEIRVVPLQLPKRTAGK